MSLYTKKSPSGLHCLRQASSRRSLSRQAQKTRTFATPSSASRSTKWRAQARLLGVVAGVGIASSLLLPSVALDEGTSTSPLKHSRKTIELAEIEKLIQEQGKTLCVIDGLIYDLTAFKERHPGGAELIEDNNGKDITALFKGLHKRGTLEANLTDDDCIGVLADSEPIEVAEAPGASDEVEERRESLPPVETVLNLKTFEELAKYVLGEESRAWRYFSSWADDGVTFDATRESYSCLRFLPRVMIPVREINSTGSFFGWGSPIPVHISPTGQNRQGHPDGEYNALRAAMATGIPQCVSNGSSVGVIELLEERTRLMKEEGLSWTPIYAQHYTQTNRAESERQIKEAVQAGASGIIVTVDVPAMGNREADKQIKVSKPGEKPGQDAGLAAAQVSLWDANLKWDDVKWAQSLAPGKPIIVKGISTVADVALAKRYGAAGVFLSNHGARQLEHSPPPIATLLRLHRERPDLLQDPNFQVHIDGGIQRGTDVLKALCLGASSVGLGRAVLYSQTCYGDQGVTRMLQILTDEVQSGMRLLGATKVGDLHPGLLELLASPKALVGEQLK